MEDSITDKLLVKFLLNDRNVELDLCAESVLVVILALLWKEKLVDVVRVCLAVLKVVKLVKLCLELVELILVIEVVERDGNEISRLVVATIEVESGMLISKFSV